MRSPEDDPSGLILEYAREIATDDVRETLTWLEGHGFRVHRAIGGRTESFGNLLLDLAGERDASVEIVRDRTQWSCAISTGDTPKHPLNVLITAMDDEPPTIPPGRLRDPLPEQLPPGVVWTTAVPRIIEWLISSDRREALDAASRQWRTAMNNWWKQQERT